jgi:tellurite resistance protein TehA-like permease
MPATESFVVAMKTVILLFGGLITFYTYRAYQRTRSVALRSLLVGLVSIVVGATLGGVAHQLFGVTLVDGVAISSGFTALGFTVMAYSLYVEAAPDVRSTSVRRGRPRNGTGD